MGTYETTMLKLEKMAQANTATQMNWQEKMSKTSHQMEVADLVKAGLNPVLSSNQGATAYSTSVDSAVNGIAGMASAREGANATRYAARQSAAATRAAAAAQIEAARLAAGASNYAADRHYESTKFQTLNSKSGSLAGIVENYFKKASIGLTNKDYKATMQNINLMQKSPEKWIKFPDQKITASNMTHQAKLRATAEFNKYGIKNNYTNRNIFAKAFIGGDKQAMKQWLALVNASKKSVNTAVKSRVGSGIW